MHFQSWGNLFALNKWEQLRWRTFYRQRLNKLGKGLEIGANAKLSGQLQNIALGENVRLESAAVVECHRETAKASIGNSAVLEASSLVSVFSGEVTLGDRTWVRRQSVIECGHPFIDSPDSYIKVDSGTIIGPMAVLVTHLGNISIGHDCTVNPFCVLYGHGGLTIGNHVRIASHTTIIPANHVFDDPDIAISKQGLSTQGVTIEDDVWIGSGVCILDGCQIGKGSVIGAGTVVTKNVEPYSIVVGVPGKVVGKRGDK